MSKTGLAQRIRIWGCTAAVLLLSIFLVTQAGAFTLHLVDGQTKQELSTTAFRYMVEVDNTFPVTPQDPVTNQLSFSIHNSYAPLATLIGGAPAQGMATGSGESVTVDPAGRYYVSVLPNAGYANGGVQVAPNQTDAWVFVEPYPLPTAQISLFAFKDHFPINNAPDNLADEPGIGGMTVVIGDPWGGPLFTDAFGNPLGTRYQPDTVNGGFLTDVDGNYLVDVMGNGVIKTLTEADYCEALGFGPMTLSTTNIVSTYCDQDVTLTANPDLNHYNLMPGEAIIKFLRPGKYGIIMYPPHDGKDYVLTSTIEGTPTVDAWVQADEAKFFVEQFGAASPWHAFFGYVIPEELPWAAGAPGGPGSIDSLNRFNHFYRPPNNMNFDVGPPVDSCWFGLNNGITGEGLYAAPCSAASRIQLSGVPEDSYELVTWDKPLDALFGFHPLNFPDLVTGSNAVTRDIMSNRWFGSLKGQVFIDENENGFPEPTEAGLQYQAVNLRFRDGTIYQATVSGPAGDYELTEVFPFFKWLVVEIDFARYKATGMTAAVDLGGTIPPANGWIVPSFDELNPQPQETGGTFVGDPLATANNNPNTGNNLSRTETGMVLTQAMQLYLNQTNRIDWEKNFYGPGGDTQWATGDDENGGISGIVYYAVTRAEDDPRYAAAEPWEPGIPNVQMALYHDDLAPFGKIDCFAADGSQEADQVACVPELADVDNVPFGWASGGVKGAEDIDHNTNGTFDYGDAVQVAYTDSWNDSFPTDCVQDLPTIHGGLPPKCGDSYGTWNQVRPGIFDGGYAFNDHYEHGVTYGLANNEAPIALTSSSTYIVEAGIPHGYTLVREQDKNVDYGDQYIPGTKNTVPICVGDAQTVPPKLVLKADDLGNPLPGVDAADVIDAPFAGTSRPLCDRRQVFLASSQNAAAEFFFYTPVPKAARGVGFINNDVAPEFNLASPAFGEKMSPSWLPVSLRDWVGNQVAYTVTDEFGAYEFLAAGSWSVDQASPSGITPAMYNIIINDPFMIDQAAPLGSRVTDPNWDPNFAVVPWVFQFETGKSSYIDSPIVPTAAFVGYPTTGLDVLAADGVPGIASVAGAFGGANVCATDETVTITSLGPTTVPNPDYDPSAPIEVPPSLANQPTISRDYGFGPDTGTGTVTVAGVALNIVTWSDTTITATVPAGVSTGDLVVTRGDNNNVNTLSVTVNVQAGCSNTLYVSTSGDDANTGLGGAPLRTIQKAVDLAASGTLILVGPGTFEENVIVYKEVSLQGSGAATIINARPAVQSQMQTWRDKLTTLGGVPNAVNEVPGILILGDSAGTVNDFAAGGNHVTIDGFKVTGGTIGGGIYVLNNGYETEIRNSIITGNQGQLGGGITVGVDDIANSGNTGVYIHDNEITKNAGVNGGGGVVFYGGSDTYRVDNNLIEGNFSRGNGGGISHVGLSNIGKIQGNIIAFNEVFYFAPGGGGGGGVYIANSPISDSSGTVIVDSNLIQGNLSGAGSGGGISVAGLSTAAEPTTYSIGIYNNMIVNNVGTDGGGGVALQDAVTVKIVNNTIANNDSTATALLAFPAGNINPSIPAPAGIMANVHSGALATAVGTAIPNPTLVNNIIYNNNAFHHPGIVNGGLTTNNLIADGVWDLGVTGEVVAGTNALNPDFSLLTSLVGYNGENYNDGSNYVGDPRFVLGYTNALVSAATLDEGGNNISVRYTPIDVAAGDYHIQNTSIAIDAGTLFSQLELQFDFDGDVRPQSVQYDSGADEFPGGAATPVITSLEGVAASPVIASATVNFTATVAPVGGFEYRFRVRDLDNPAWVDDSGYTPSNMFAWDTTGLGGNYRIIVYVRNPADPTLNDVAFTRYYVASSTPVTDVTLGADADPPVLQGTTVNFTSLATGTSGNYVYRFRVRDLDNPAWIADSGYTSSGSFAWNTAGLDGNFRVIVYAKNAGSPAASEAVRFLAYTVNTSPPASDVTLQASAEPPVGQTTVNFTSLASGGSGSYEYRYRVRNLDTPGWVPGSDSGYGPGAYAWDTTGLSGNYRVIVYARNVGSTLTEAVRYLNYLVTP